MPIITAGAPLPVEPQGRFYEIVTVKGDERLRCTLLAPSFTGYWLHWDGCPLRCATTADCRWCQAEMPHRWQGYAPIWHLGEHKRAILHLSEGAARQCAALQEQCGTLAGVGVEVRKKFPTKTNSSYVVTFMGQVNPEEFYEAHPIEDSINRLLGINEVRYVHRGRAVKPPIVTAANAGVPLPPAQPSGTTGTAGQTPRHTPASVVKTRTTGGENATPPAMQEVWRDVLRKKGVG